MVTEHPKSQADDRAWAAQIGPAHPPDAVAALLQLRVEDVATQPGLVRLTQRNGEVVYPVFQFDGPRLLEGISDVVATLTPVMASTWTIASWLTSPQPSLDGDRPSGRLRAGDSRPVTALARSVQGLHRRLLDAGCSGPPDE